MVDSINSTSSVGLVTTTTTQTTTATGSSDAFAQALATAETSSSSGVASISNAANGRADFISGQLGIELNDRGVPMNVLYFDTNGQLLTSSSFDAPQILKFTHEFGISLTDLTGLGQQMDAANIGYRPYELYPGTRSNHGIDFDNLIAGGMGTAYDWTEDPLVSMKGPSALKSLEANRQLAEDLGISSVLATRPSTSTTSSDTSAAVTAAAATLTSAVDATNGVAQAADTSTAEVAEAVASVLEATTEETAGSLTSADESDVTTSVEEQLDDLLASLSDALDEAVANAGAETTASEGTSEQLSESLQNELIQLVNNLSVQQPALAQHLLAVLQSSVGTTEAA